MEKYSVSEYINILKDKGLLNKTVKCEIHPNLSFFPSQITDDLGIA